MLLNSGVARVMARTDFHYEPECSVADCAQAATYKVAAVWTDGKFRELKPYGLACEAHRDNVLIDANRRRAGLRLAEGEQVEEIGIYRLERDARDAKLIRIEPKA